MSSSPPISELAPSHLFSLKGKVAVVTGGSRGIGKEICRAFAAAGCDVVIASRKMDGCKALAEQIQTECPGRRAVPFACNVGNWTDCQSLFDFAYKEFKKVDILVNNAGGSPLYPSLKQVDESYFDKIMGLNLKGPFRLGVLFGSKMCEQADGGSIINVSTIGTVMPGPRETVYGAAKAGVNYLTQSLAHAYGPKVRVNCLLPGAFLTDISKAWDVQEGRKAWQRGTALMRAGRADEMVGAALYFASEASSFSTGAILHVTGLPGSTGRDPDHGVNLDYERDVLPKMRDARLSKL